uniref:G_PROTEIN_RECEP_F1_2 domain-containing protein n=1 Tax=Panagrellus redivivus TaxID=6233 RepID=A0A7E4USP8_PANRE
MENTDISVYGAYIRDHSAEYTEKVLFGIIARMFIMFFGIWGNFNLIYAVYRNPGLRSCSGILLAITAIANTFHQSSHLFYTYLVFAKVNLVTVRTCVFVNTLPNIGFHVGLLMVFFLAVDRLICVLFPVTRRRMTETTFIAIYMLITSIITVFFVSFAYYELFRLGPGQLVFCLVTDGLPGRAGRSWFFVCLIGSSLALVCYVIIWVLLKMSKRKQKDSGTAKMFKSLFSICVVICTCWMAIGTLFVCVALIDIPTMDAWFIRYNLGVAINFACSCNYYILFYCRTNVRRKGHKRIILANF